jgi:hypothetical protein
MLCLCVIACKSSRGSEWSQLPATLVEVVHALREQPWGQRVFRVRDPDGRIIELRAPMWVVVKRFLARGMTPEEIAARTAMPLEVIKHIESA